MTSDSIITIKGLKKEENTSFILVWIVVLFSFMALRLTLKKLDLNPDFALGVFFIGFIHIIYLVIKWNINHKNEIHFYPDRILVSIGKRNETFGLETIRSISLKIVSEEKGCLICQFSAISSMYSDYNNGFENKLKIEFYNKEPLSLYFYINNQTTKKLIDSSKIELSDKYSITVN